MSVTNKSHSTQNNFHCQVCKINIHTEAEYALHEFSKKHCDNLLRVAKNKPVASKQKSVRPEPPQTPTNKETPKFSSCAPQGSIAKYGYFVPGEVYDTGGETKEFNTEYDPYLQKYAENPFKEISQPVAKSVEAPLLPMENITCFKRKKKKKIRTCQICNVTLLTVPEYEAHMRSPQHSWMLKMSGMGVSAHFVKASTDLHTVELNEHSASDKQVDAEDSKSSDVAISSSTTVFPTLYCDICELLLNSEQQFNAHVNGKSHNDNVQRKAEIKAKKLQMQGPSSNQLYCFSCKVALNNLYQYNEHKYGKKHKMKCRRLMREGITIPPEERVASWGMPKLDPSKPVVYPEMYEKFLRECQEKVDGGRSEDHTKDSNIEKILEPCSDNPCEISTKEGHIDSEDHHSAVKNESENLTINYENTLENEPKIVFHNVRYDNTESKINENNLTETGRTIDHNSKLSEEVSQHYIIGPSDFISCNLCDQKFIEQTQYDIHLTTQEHAKKILEIKDSGKRDEEILEIILRDRAVVKPDKQGRFLCSLCSVNTGNVTELHQHITSVLHKRSEEEYGKRRKIEIISAVKPDETGCFTCKPCLETYNTLMEYNDHLHTMKHRDTIKAEKAKKILDKKRLLLQKRRVKQKYIISGLKRKDFACWRRNCEKNPGVRTKIAGMAMDLCTGFKASIPNLEPLEPKIDSTRNVSIGILDSKRKVEEDKSKTNKKRRKASRAPEPYRPVIKPLMALNGPRPFSVGIPPPRPLIPLTNWNPYPPFHNFRYNSFRGVPRPMFPVNRYHCPPNFHPPWPRYRPCYK